MRLEDNKEPQRGQENEVLYWSRLHPAGTQASTANQLTHLKLYSQAGSGLVPGFPTQIQVLVCILCCSGMVLWGELQRKCNVLQPQGRGEKGHKLQEPESAPMKKNKEMKREMKRKRGRKKCATVQWAQEPEPMDGVEGVEPRVWGRERQHREREE